MDKAELTAWALANGWQMIAGCPSLTKPRSPKEAMEVQANVASSASQMVFMGAKLAGRQGQAYRRPG